MNELILKIDRLKVDVPAPDGFRRILRDVSLSVAPGEALGLVGESGSGKSMTTRAVVGNLPKGAAASGTVTVAGVDVLTCPRQRLRSLLTDTVGTVFQDPRSSINPLHSVGDHITEVLRVNRGVTRKAAEMRAVALLKRVGIDDAHRRLRSYPHELSGGLLQRVMIAGALATSPKILLADEPTTALDVTTQAEVMALLNELRQEDGLALLFITHDLELAAAVCDRTCVMYAGQILEEQPSAALHEAAQHPYTRGLLGARPSVVDRPERLNVIPGRPQLADEVSHGCVFAQRCADVLPGRCDNEQEMRVAGRGVARCCRVSDAIRVEAGNHG